MISRMRYYDSLLRIAVYTLPLFAFGISAYSKFGTIWLRHVSTVVPQYYLILLGFTEFVWVLAANYYELPSVADLFWEYTGIRAAFLACFVTLLLQTALLVFVKQLIVSRIFILLSNVILFLGVVIARNFFRLTSESSGWMRKREKILVVGTDQYARRSVNLLRRIPFFAAKSRLICNYPDNPCWFATHPLLVL